jgi:hypothetical protein
VLVALQHRGSASESAAPPEMGAPEAVLPPSKSLAAPLLPTSLSSLVPMPPVSDSYVPLPSYMTLGALAGAHSPSPGQSPVHSPQLTPAAAVAVPSDATV